MKIKAATALSKKYFLNPVYKITTADKLHISFQQGVKLQAFCDHTGLSWIYVLKINNFPKKI